MDHVAKRGHVRRLATAAALCLLAAGAPAWSGDWRPGRPVALIVGSAPGGSIDLTARIMQHIWDTRRIVGVPVVVINKPGAGNGIAWSYLNDRGGDGQAIAIGTTNLVTNPIIGSHPIGYRDVTPLAILFDDYMGFVVRADSPLKSMRDVAQRLRRDPAALSVAFAPALGSGSHTAAAMALKAAGVEVRNARFVVYKSAGEAISAMLGGEIDVVSATVANLPPFMQSGRVRVLAVTAPGRLGGTLAGVPTLKEQGVDAVFTNWRGVIGPRDMRAEHIAYWDRMLSELNRTDDWQKELERHFWSPNFLTGAAARDFIARKAEEFRAIWADIGVTNRKSR